MRWLDCFLESLPARLRRIFLDQVDRTPGAFLEMYQDLRKHIVQEFGLLGKARVFAPQTNLIPGAFAAKDPRAAVRRAVAGRMGPPALESAGIMDDRLPGASRQAELKSLVKRVKSGGAREGDLLRYIELTMRGSGN